VILNPSSLNPIVILNVYAQVLTVSIAEIIVCWGVIGVSFEALSRTRGRVVSIFVGILMADFLFGIYIISLTARLLTKLVWFYS
jgi:hypothetical protein